MLSTRRLLYLELSICYIQPRNMSQWIQIDCTDCERRGNNRDMLYEVYARPNGRFMNSDLTDLNWNTADSQEHMDAQAPTRHLPLRSYLPT